MKFLKNLFLFLLLVAVIVGSFSVSFVIGKRVLVPTKKIPTKSFLADKGLDRSPLSEAISIEVETTAREMDELASKYLKDEKFEEEKVIENPVVKKPAVKKAVPIKTSSSGKYNIQVGAFSVKGNADSLKAELKGKGYPASVVRIGKYYRVYVGAFNYLSEAKTQANKLRSSGYEAFIRR